MRVGDTVRVNCDYYAALGVPKGSDGVVTAPDADITNGDKLVMVDFEEDHHFPVFVKHLINTYQGEVL